MKGDQPCDLAASPVSRNILVLSQPTTGARAPPAENHNVLLASSANAMWWVVKHRSIWVILSVWGSYSAACRPALSIGNSLAEGRSEPLRQKSGVAGLRMRAVSQSRPSRSSIGLCTEVWLCQIISSPQWGDGSRGKPPDWMNE